MSEDRATYSAGRKNEVLKVSLKNFKVFLSWFFSKDQPLGQIVRKFF